MTISVHLEFASVDEAAKFFGTYSMGKNFGGVTTTPTTPIETVEHLKNLAPKTVKGDAPEKATPAPAPVAAPTPAAAAPTPVAAPAPAVPSAAAAVTYDTYADAAGNKLSETIAKLVAKDKAKVVALLTELGVKRGPLLTAEQWPVAMQKFSDALAAAELA